MNGNRFFAALLFAVIAALASVAWLLVAAPVLGSHRAIALFSAIASALYLLSIAPSRAQGIRFAVIALGLLAASSLTVGSSGGLLIASVFVLAVIRSGFLYRSRPARALLTEALLAAFGFLFARALFGQGPLGLAMAVWGFFLVQSTFFLLGSPRPQVERSTVVDPFEQASRRAEEILARPFPNL